MTFDNAYHSEADCESAPLLVNAVEEVYDLFLLHQICHLKLCGWEAGHAELGAGPLGLSCCSRPAANEATCGPQPGAGARANAATCLLQAFSLTETQLQGN